MNLEISKGKNGGGGASESQECGTEGHQVFIQDG